MITPEQKATIVTRLVDTAGLSEGALCDELGIGLEDLEEIMVDAGYERCSECEWWCETSELVDDDNEPCPCDGCKKKGDE